MFKIQAAHTTYELFDRLDIVCTHIYADGGEFPWRKVKVKAYNIK